MTLKVFDHTGHLLHLKTAQPDKDWVFDRTEVLILNLSQGDRLYFGIDMDGESNYDFAEMMWVIKKED